MTDTLSQLTCQRCGHSWWPRTPGRPGVCPKCKRHDWDTHPATARISLYDNRGEVQSEGIVTVKGTRVSFGEWIYGGTHVDRLPVGLIRRIALDWVADGADRRYTGHDEQADTAFVVEPA
jgi:hypothetical protein